MPPPATPRDGCSEPSRRASRRPVLRSLLTRATAVVVAATAFSAIPVVPGATPAAQASSVYLCQGYEGCASRGYGNGGYAQNNRNMYWRMYAGHNCTNYVAYRMIQRGMSPERPWDGTGMAYNWGLAMDHITDDQPAVGSVAWWGKGASGASSSGHVAYVEQVVSPTEIIISEDAWGGDFYWRRVIKDGTGWPSGFIHFVDTKTFTNKTPPKVTGPARVGGTLRAYVARWSPGADHSLQWFAGGTAVPGATGLRWQVSPDAVGKPITVRSTATRQGYQAASAVSAPTGAVAKGSYQRVAQPTVSGSPMVGQTLTAGAASWSPQPDAPQVRWRADGVWLRDRTGPTLQVTDDLVGKKIDVVEVAADRGYQRLFAASMPTEPVAAGAVQMRNPFAASGRLAPGETVSFGAGTWAPRGARPTYSWWRDGTRLPDVTGPTYRLRPADLGHRLVVRADVTKQHYRPLRRTADFGVVTSPPRLVVKPRGRQRAALIIVRVGAPAVETVRGYVVATVNNHRRVVKLRDGEARLRLSGLGRGTRPVEVEYLGSRKVRATRASAQVVVKP